MKIKNISSAEQKKLNKAFLLAVSAGNLKQAQHFLDRGADVNVKDANGCSALLYLCQNGSREEIEALLKNDPDLYVKDKEGRSVGHYAAGNQDSAVFNYVMAKCPVNLNASDKKNRSALWYAVEKNLYQNVQSYLYGSDTLDVDRVEIGGETVLTKAAQKPERFEILKLLLPYAEKGVESCNQSQNTLLHIAVENQNDVLRDFLLANKANVNACNFSGQTPLMLAAGKGDEQTVEVLLKAGAHANALDNARNGTIMYGVYGNNERVIDLLVQHGADLNQENAEGLFPLTAAACGGQYEMFDLLHQKGAALNAYNYRGRTVAQMYSLLNHQNLEEVLRQNHVYIYFPPAQKAEDLLIPVSGNDSASEPEESISTLHNSLYQAQKKSAEAENSSPTKENQTLSSFSRVREMAETAETLVPKADRHLPE